MGRNPAKKKRSDLRFMYVLYMQGTAGFKVSTSWPPCGVNGRDVTISTGMDGLGAVFEACMWKVW
jgi:hypothetical protein